MGLRKLNHDCLTSTFAYLPINQQVHFRLVCSAWYEPLSVCLGRHRSLAIQSINKDFDYSLRLSGRHQVGLPKFLLTLSSSVPSPTLITILGRLFPRLDVFFCFVTVSTCKEQTIFLEALKILPIWRLQQLNLIIRNVSDHPITDSLWRALESSFTSSGDEASRLFSLRLPNQSLPETINHQTLRLLGTLETLQLLKMDITQITSNFLPSNLRSLHLGALLLHPQGIGDPLPPQPSKVNCTLKHLSIRCLRGCIMGPRPLMNPWNTAQKRTLAHWTFDFAVGSFQGLESFHFEITNYDIFPIFRSVTRLIFPLSHLTHLALPGLFLLNALAPELSNQPPCRSLPSIRSLSLLGFEPANCQVAYLQAESLGNLLGTVFPRLQKLIVHLHPDTPDTLKSSLQTMATRWLANVKLQIKRDPSVRLSFTLQSKGTL